MNNIKLYLDNGEGLQEIPIRKYPSETIIRTLRETYGIDHPILMQQGKIGFYEVTILGKNEVKFRVYKG